MDRDAAPVASDDAYMAAMRPMLAGTTLEVRGQQWWQRGGNVPPWTLSSLAHRERRRSRSSACTAPPRTGGPQVSSAPAFHHAPGATAGLQLTPRTPPLMHHAQTRSTRRCTATARASSSGAPRAALCLADTTRWGSTGAPGRPARGSACAALAAAAAPASCLREVHFAGAGTGRTRRPTARSSFRSPTATSRRGPSSCPRSARTRWPLSTAPTKGRRLHQGPDWAAPGAFPQAPPSPLARHHRAATHAVWARRPQDPPDGRQGVPSQGVQQAHRVCATAQRRQELVRPRCVRACGVCKQAVLERAWSAIQDGAPMDTAVRAQGRAARRSWWSCAPTCAREASSSTRSTVRRCQGNACRRPCAHFPAQRRERTTQESSPNQKCVCAHAGLRWTSEYVKDGSGEGPPPGIFSM